MSEHDKNFYSLEELQRTRDNLEGYLDGEEVYYFVGTIRYACDEIERLNNIINKAIEYIEHEWFKRCQLGITDRTFYECDMNNLLEILKGEDKE